MAENNINILDKNNTTHLIFLGIIKYNNNEIIENGNFYVNNVYFEGSKANVLLNNQFATEYNTEKTTISLVSNQSVDFTNASSPEINNNNSIVAKTELFGIILGGDISFDLSSNPQSNNGISNAGHTIKSKDKILNFLSFDETYRFEKSSKLLAKENKISTNFYDFGIPILLDLSTIAKDTLYTQNQNTNLKFNFQIPIFDLLIDSTTNANVSQKAQKGFSQTPQIQNYQYFAYWLSTTKLAFSTGLSNAYSRTEEYEEKITVTTPYLNFTPDILINFKQNYNNQINAIHKDTTTIKINLPLTFKNNYFSFSWEKSISNNANTTTNGNYLSDTKQLFASQQQNSWFYGVFPFADLFIKTIPNKINNLQKNVSKAYNSTYKLQWKRKLFNTNSDLVIFTKGNQNQEYISNLDTKYISNKTYAKSNHNNFTIFTIDVSNKGIRNTDFSQWENLIEDLDNTKKNVLIILNNSLDTFNDNLEKEFLLNTLVNKSEETGNKYWIIQNGKTTNSVNYNGIKILTIGNSSIVNTNISTVIDNYKYINIYI